MMQPNLLKFDQPVCKYKAAPFFCVIRRRRSPRCAHFRECPALRRHRRVSAPVALRLLRPSGAFALRYSKMFAQILI